MRRTSRANMTVYLLWRASFESVRLWRRGVCRCVNGPLHRQWTMGGAGYRKSETASASKAQVVVREKEVQTPALEIWRRCRALSSCHHRRLRKTNYIQSAGVKFLVRRLALLASVTGEYRHRLPTTRVSSRLKAFSLLGFSLASLVHHLYGIEDRGCID